MAACGGSVGFCFGNEEVVGHWFAVHGDEAYVAYDELNAPIFHIRDSVKSSGVTHRWYTVKRHGKALRTSSSPHKMYCNKG